MCIRGILPNNYCVTQLQHKNVNYNKHAKVEDEPHKETVLLGYNIQKQGYWGL